MSSNDPTQELPEDKTKTTQPMISDVFRLVEEIKQSIETHFHAIDKRFDQIDTRLDGIDTRLDGIDTRLDGIDTRLDELESRTARDTASINARLVELSDEMKSGFMRLEDKIDRSRLHAEADYHDLLKRIRQLESKAS